MKKLLVIEDDPAILQGLAAGLELEHFEVLTAADGEKGFLMAQRENIDLVILDLMLPGKNGEEICRDLRAKGINVPIIMLTSKSTETDKVVGLELGADDYVTKPFSLRELQARIAAVLRRRPVPTKEIDTCAFGGVTLDFRKQEAVRSGASVHLSAREFDVMKFFAVHEGEVVTREMLLNAVWGYEEFPTTRTVDNYILSIRKKLEENPSQPAHLITIHTAGYKFVKKSGG